MEFSTKSANPAKVKSGCVIVGVFEGRKLTPAGQAVDSASRRYLTEVLKRGDLDGKVGSTLLLQKVRGIAPERVLLVGLGPEREYGETAFRGAVAAATR